MPDRLSITLDKVQKDELKLNMEHQGLDDLIRRLSICLILAALIVGSSIADKGLKILDGSAIGFSGFVFSAILGDYLIFRYIRS